jgi:hypothetical protein
MRRAAAGRRIAVPRHFFNGTQRDFLSGAVTRAESGGQRRKASLGPPELKEAAS